MTNNLGQFFTTNSNLILQGFEEFVDGKNILDPFAGNGDLIKWAKENNAKAVYGYDIDKSLLNETISFNDSLKHIPNSDFILTNPPYLASNKANKGLEYNIDYQGYEDLYQLSIKKIIESNPSGGIVIVPVNFLSSENSRKIRKEFFKKFKILKINYFKNKVFDDTTYNVIAFNFIKDDENITKELNFTIYPDGTNISFTVSRDFDFSIAGEDIGRIINYKQNLNIYRLTEEILLKHPGDHNLNTYYNDFKTEKSFNVVQDFIEKVNNNIIAINCIDTLNNKICYFDIRKYNPPALAGKITSRNIAHIIIDNNISLENQIGLIEKANYELNSLRNKYFSLFLTNFRDNDRKRISFDFSYKLLNYCYGKYILKG